MSRKSVHGVVVTGVSPELDALKQTYSNLQDRLKVICQNYTASLTDEAQDNVVGCIFHPQRGYLLVAAVTTRVGSNCDIEDYNPGGDLDLSTLEDASLEDGLVYFKTPSLRAVDNEFGDLAGQIIGWSNQAESKWVHHVRFSSFIVCSAVPSLTLARLGSKTISRPQSGDHGERGYIARGVTGGGGD